MVLSIPAGVVQCHIFLVSFDFPACFPKRSQKVFAVYFLFIVCTVCFRWLGQYFLKDNLGIPPATRTRVR